MTEHSYGTVGIHRAPVWCIAGFALNNAATHLYLLMMSFACYAYLGNLGFGLYEAIGLTVILCLWVGATAPFFGRIIDRTSGKFGKNRPFMVIGNAVMCLASCLLVHLAHKISGNAFRGMFLLIFGALYYAGYSLQCVVTKSAQSCLTSDPKQRPLFAAFDSVFSIALLAGAVIVIPVMNSYEDTAASFHILWVLTACVSAAFTVISVISIAPKDTRVYFGTGKYVPISKQDFRDTLKNNRAIRMLAIAASTDKLTLTAGISATMILSTLMGSWLLETSVIVWTAVPAAILAFLLTAFLGAKWGQKETLKLASWIGIGLNAAMACLWIFGDPAGGNVLFTITYVAGTALLLAFRSVSGNLMIPMTADCVDYEVYRTGKYIPGQMGVMLSFVDKLAAMLAPVIAVPFVAVGIVFACTVESDAAIIGMQIGAVVLIYGLGILRLVCNLIIMKFYPLTKAKMVEIHSGISAMEAES